MDVRRTQQTVLRSPARPRVDRGLEMLFKVSLKVFLAEPNEFAYSDEPNAPLVDQPPHKPQRHAESRSGVIDRERRLKPTGGI
jgi:hypothetical protein